MEMKIIALMNLRIGPDRVGPFGSLLSVVHGLKVLMKEDFTPTGADSLVFTWAPVVVYLASDLSSAVTGEVLYVDGGFNILGVPTGGTTG